MHSKSSLTGLAALSSAAMESGSNTNTRSSQSPNTITTATTATTATTTTNVSTPFLGMSVIGFHPSMGPENETITLTVKPDPQLISTLSSLSFAIHFGLCQANSSHALSFNTIIFSAVVPLFETTQWPFVKVPLTLYVFDSKENRVLDSLLIGEFVYVKVAPSNKIENRVTTLSTKRALENEPQNQQQGQQVPQTQSQPATLGRPSKKSSIEAQKPKQNSASSSTSFSTLVPPSPLATLTSALSSASVSFLQTSPSSSSPSSSNPTAASSSSNANANANINNPIPSSSSSNTKGEALLMEISKTGPKPKKSVDKFRTICISTDSISALRNRLSRIISNWTPEEKTMGRKLVYFWVTGSPSGDTIQCSTEVPSQNHFIISCLYWQKQNEYFFTSVDCLSLLEGVLDSKFSIEQKNRIRRNLEGFQPLTISKSRAFCEDFFHLIMSLPKPRPRNIEKDVKVFPWKMLTSAIFKIIIRLTKSEYVGHSHINLREDLLPFDLDDSQMNDVESGDELQIENEVKDQDQDDSTEKKKQVDNKMPISHLLC